jgi:hypothetical protein
MTATPPDYALTTITAIDVLQRTDEFEYCASLQELLTRLAARCISYPHKFAIII